MASQPTAEARAEAMLTMRCPRCGSQLFHNYGVIECYACGWDDEPVLVPLPMSHRGGH